MAVWRAFGLVGQADFALFHGKRMGLGVEGVGFDLEIAGKFGQRGFGVGQGLAQNLPAGFAGQRVRDRHAPRLVGQDDQRGRLFFHLGVNERGPEHGEDGQHDHAQSQAGQRQRRRQLSRSFPGIRANNAKSATAMTITSK